jgi:hypothetical protein
MMNVVMLIVDTLGVIASLSDPDYDIFKLSAAKIDKKCNFSLFSNQLGGNVIKHFS